MFAVRYNSAARLLAAAIRKLVLGVEVLVVLLSYTTYTSGQNLEQAPSRISVGIALAKDFGC